MRWWVLLLAVLATAPSASAQGSALRLPTALPVVAAVVDLEQPAPRAAVAAARPSRPPKPARTVRGAIRRALLTGAISQRRHDDLRRRWRDAERLARRLPGRRAGELRGALAGVEELARRRKLTPTRLGLAFLVVRRNVALWSAAPLPAGPKARRTVGRDPLVLQAYPGRGWQPQPLATAGTLNALARVCLRRRAGLPTAGARCRPAALTRTADRLAQLAVRRGRARAWEHLFAFGGARPGWISGMTQATAIQALTRAASVVRRDEPDRARRWRVLAREALRAFERRPPVGVAVPASGGRFFALYSDLPRLRVVNAHLQALIGLREAASRGLSVRAGRAFRSGLRAARPAVRAADTGAWSLYAVGGRESDLGYHRLVRGFLRTLCHQTRRGLFCGPSSRFARYEREPPRVAVRTAPRPRRGRATTVRVSLSKVAHVRVRVAGPRGPALDAELQLARGTHALRWVPPRPGRFRVTVRAAALSGPRTLVGRTVRVPAPRPKPKRAKAKAKPKAGAERR